MAIVVTDDRHYKAIAEAIKKSVPMWKDGIRPEWMDSGVDDVYAVAYGTGRIDGTAEGEVLGAEIGREAERNDFFRTFQNNGNETNYYYAFAYGRFTDANYDPKYDIVCSSGTTTSSQNVFYNASEITDTKVAIYARGRSASNMFYGCTALRTIQKLVVYVGLTYANTFTNCTALTNLTIEGEIGASIDLHWSPLSRESLISVVNALDDASYATLTVSSAAVNAAFPNRVEWDALFENKPTWEISEV